MGWLADLFSSSQRKTQALSSTHDAFSLPTSSPIHPQHPDVFSSDAFHTPEPAMSPSVYTYPPQGPGSYGFVPNSAGLSRPASGALLPTHMDPLHTPLSAPNAYPPLAKSWARIRAWLSREYPELGDTLNYGILPQDLQHIEMQFGFALPAVVRESYLCCDGQEAESAAGCSEGLFFGLRMLPLEDVFEEWRFWREVDSDPATGANARLREAMQSVPPGWVRREYSQRGWIPLVADKTGNYVGVDMNPAEGGQVGQVIVFGRDFDTKVVLWRGDGPTGWAKWLSSFVEELESGEGFELDPPDVSDDSEDELGYESYFYDGKGRGQGDGGGDTGGVGGLRLTGVYKGWNVMEAWADRSLRKWHEAGVVSDVSLLPPEEEEDIKSKGIDGVGLGVVDVNHGSGAEIPIPVLADVDDPIPPPTQMALSGKRAPQTQPQDIPTIAITKPPAPRPVDVPTVQDIEDSPSPPSSFDEDLESGRGRGIREEIQEPPAPSSRRPVQPQPIVPIPHGASGLGSTDDVTPPADATAPLVQVSRMSSDPLTDQPILDLLADPGPALDTKPIEPSASASPVVVTADQPLTESPKLVETIELPVAPEIQQQLQEEEEPPATTIRLIGGGGTSGVADVEPRLIEAPVHVEKVAQAQAEGDSASVTSASSDSGPATKKGKVHKKTKSGLAGLKRFSQFGGLKKQDLKDG